MKLNRTLSIIALVLLAASVETDSDADTTVDDADALDDTDAADDAADVARDAADADLLHQVTEPLLAPFRRLIPPMGGLDFSVMVVFLVLVMIREYLLPGIAFELGIGRAALG